MPKKDTSSAVLGMLSNAGAQTRPAARSGSKVPGETAVVVSTPVVADPPEPAMVEPEPDQRPSATVSALPAPPASSAKDAAPRTLRLRPATAQALRDAWLEAKRDDVLLTAQDFASALVDEALVRRCAQRASVAH